ncbi:MAG: hypothetical protein AB2794_03920 [Candidatus Thiodiazotropha endolucinida]
MLSRNAFAREKTGISAPRPHFRKSPLALVLAVCFLILTSVTVVAEEPQTDWKTLPEYMAMDRDAQRQLISHTRRLVMRKLAETDLDRAECVSWLFNFDTEEGQKQFYTIKGMLKTAAEDGSTWNAQQVVAHIITKEYCPSRHSN